MPTTGNAWGFSHFTLLRTLKHPPLATFRLKLAKHPQTTIAASSLLTDELMAQKVNRKRLTFWPGNCIRKTFVVIQEAPSRNGSNPIARARLIAFVTMR